jgi:Tol biopolymer transport system component
MTWSRRFCIIGSCLLPLLMGIVACGGDSEDAAGADASRIAFVSDRDGHRRIYVMNADGSGQRAVSDPAYGSDTWPTWSPDGARIAFVSDENGQDDIYVIDADGRNRRNITNTPDSGDWSPAWSPGGTRIAFTSDREPAGLYVMDPDGGNPLHLSADAWSPAWSPDGLQIVVYVTGRRNDGSSMSVIDADGGVRWAVEDGGVAGGRPTWSPDNAWLAATAANDSEPLARMHDWQSIILMDVFGRNRRIVTHNRRGTDRSPTWSPDARLIAYEAHDGMLIGDSHYRSDIHVLNLDDMSVRRLTNSRDYDGMPAWSR